MSVTGVGSYLSTSPIYPSSSVDATSPSDPSDAQNLRQMQRTQFRSDFAALLAAVKAGDMSSAQQALTAVQNDRASTSATYSSQTVPGNSPISSDLQSLFSAVQSGDPTAAQQALTQFQTDAKQDAQAAGAHGHHHRHHHSSDSTDPTTTDPNVAAQTLTA